MRGRYPDGLELLDKFDGSADDKERVRLIWETVFGLARVRQVCRQLGIGETRFRQLRDLTVRGSLEGIRCRPAGRPSRRATADAQRIRELEQALAAKELELQEALVYAEVALIVPGRLAGATSEKKTRRSSARLRRQKPR